MTKTIQLALIGASILAAAPALAQTVTKGDRMTCHQTATGRTLCNSPVSLQEGPRNFPAPEQRIYRSNPYGWSTDGSDRASSPNAGGAVM